MGNTPNVKRKHFRFPAYDDESGVKLTTEPARVLFEHDDVIPKQATAKQGASKKNDYIPASKRNVNYQEELSDHRQHLPEYKSISEKRRSGITDTPKKKQLFCAKNVKVHTTPARTTTTSRSYQAPSRSYFRPKYIPASIIPDEQEPTFTDEELMTSMQKQQSAYLLFDDSEAAFQVKQEGDPTVKKFNHPGTGEIPVTRRQYQQIKPEVGRFEDSDNLPRSRKAFKQAKENARGETAYGKKQADKGRQILDRSLSGIMEDEQVPPDDNKYFQ